MSRTETGEELSAEGSSPEVIVRTASHTQE